MLSRTKWAVQDRAKFEGLILHLKDFTDPLIQMTPDQSQTIYEIAEEDIASIVGLGRLRLVESACEGSYPRWSAKASDIIRGSEIGTIDRRNFEEIIWDNDDADVVASSVRSEEHDDDRKEREGEYTACSCLSWINMTSDLPSNVIRPPTKRFFVLTRSCLGIDANSHSDKHLIGPKSFSNQSLSFSCDYPYKWNLDRRLLDHVDALIYIDLDEMRNRRYEQMRIGNQLPDIDPLGVVYVYCAPCACQMQTAADLCRGRGISKFLDFALRIDERIPSGCHRMTTGLALLSSLRNYANEVIANGQSHHRMDYIDWP